MPTLHAEMGGQDLRPLKAVAFPSFQYFMLSLRMNYSWYETFVAHLSKRICDVRPVDM